MKKYSLIVIILAIAFVNSASAEPEEVREYIPQEKPENIVMLSPGISLRVPDSLVEKIKKTLHGEEFVVRLADQEDNNIHISVRGSVNATDLEKKKSEFLVGLVEKKEFISYPFDIGNPKEKDIFFVEGVTVKKEKEELNVVFVLVPKPNGKAVLIAVYNRVKGDPERLKAILADFLGGLKISS